jgi:glycosyltransferase involved in cell wall biosynthesis
MTSRQRIAVFISFSGNGGVERMIVNLCTGFSRRGYQVDLLLIKDRSDHLAHLPDDVNVIRLGSKHAYSSLWRLVKYLRAERPDALLSAKERANRIALLARKLSGLNITVGTRLGTTVSAALAGKNRLQRFLWFWPMKLTYRHADVVIPVSQGVADDVIKITGIDSNRVKVIRNPVISPRMFELSRQPLSHPEWFDGSIPTLVAAGRFTRQKDFITLIRALKQINLEFPCRLVLLGEEGGLREQYSALAIELGIQRYLLMPGFTNNPYPVISHADCFVLSSLWEGSPNVLTEALALGTPVVATDCPSGPAEILRNGYYGPLVPMGDAGAMAQAIIGVLKNPHPRKFLQRASEEYTIDRSVTNYLKALRLTD